MRARSARILQARDQLVGAAVLRPWRNRRGQARAARHVRILIGGDANAARARRFDELDHFLHAAEVLLAGDLDVKDVHGNAGALADGNRFLDAVAQLQAVVAKMRRIQAACRGFRDFAELVDVGKRIRRIDQAGRHAKDALAHRRRHDLLHVADVFRRGLLVVLADHQFAHRAGADVGQQVRRDAAFLDRGEVAVEIRPVRRRRRGLARRHRSRLADHFRRDALANLALAVAVRDERHVGVAVHVDEAGRDGAALRIDRLRRRALHLADRGDLAVDDRDRSLARRAAGAVDDLRVRDQHVERRRGCLRRRSLTSRREQPSEPPRTSHGGIAA